MIHTALLAIASLGVTYTVHAATPSPITPDAIKAIGIKVADWQIAAEAAKPRHHPLKWTTAALYSGMFEFSKITEDSTYINWLNAIGKAHNWKLYRRPYHADDHTVGQMYLSLYRIFNDPAMIKPTRKQFDWILANPKKGSLRYTGYGTKARTDWLNRWGWCDALFMAPPVWARLATITGEQKYLDFMDQEYHATYDLLWDAEEHLFWRDSSFFPKREKNGRKLFWARGNGWVFGGLALMIPDLPADWEARQFYIDLFKTMAATLKSIQRADGTWSMGLLGGVEGCPTKETSGSSFFVFGLAWGINNGILDKGEYEPVVMKGWRALTECVREDGLLGYVQPIGAAPGKANADLSEVYGVGAFLAATAEVYKLVGGRLPKQATPEAGPALCTARHVPERLDDFAWENDRIAFRVYGPALWKKEADKCGSGVDVWVKKVRYPIIDKWYKSGQYHEDSGEGADLYKVGTSRGCGGTGIWIDGKLYTSANWASQKVIKGKGSEIAFELTYAPWEAGNLTVSEIKRISMAAGSNLFKVESTFTIEGAPTATVAVGIVRRGDAGELSHGDNWVSYAEPDHPRNGQTYCAAIVPINAMFKETKEHGLLLAEVESGKPFTYYAGAGWSKGLDFKNNEAWLEHLKQEAADRIQYEN